MARPATAKGSIAWSFRLERLAVWSLLLGLGFMFLLPFFITLGDSLKSFAQVFAAPRIWIPWPAVVAGP